MKNKIILVIIMILIIFIICFSLINNCNKKAAKTIKEINEEENLEQKLDEKINEVISNLTLEEKIAQMLIISTNETKMNEKLKSELESVGGVILFSKNITTYEQTLNFINDIKSTAKIPMFISVDEEGGKVQRLTSLKNIKLKSIPSMFSIGKKNDEELSYNIGKLLAERLRVFGFNMDFAPVVDVIDSEDNKIIGTRSFSTDENVVTNMAFNVYKGLTDNKVIGVYKHFPGHGYAKSDSHLGLPVINKTKEELLNLDLVPYKYAIKNGLDAIMVAHLSLPKITNDNTPSSLSKTIVTDLLRNELHFNGVVITDGLNMKALTNNYSEKEIYESSINAGVDILLIPVSSKSAIEKIKTSINEGIINENRINESVKRILKLKYKYLNNYELLEKDTLTNSDALNIINGIN